MSLVRVKKFLIEVVGLQSSRARLSALAVASTIIYLLPYGTVGKFSLWQRIGWESAPSIGLTRAYWLLLHGQPSAAWNRNWLIYPVLLVVIIIAVIDIYKLLRNFSVRNEQT